jgi:hypothetical protein
LLTLGIGKSKLLEKPFLLTLKSESVRRHYNFLVSLGISPNKINSSIELLYVTSDNVKTKFDLLINKLKFPKATVCNYPFVLNLSLENLEKKVAFLTGLGIDQDKIGKFPSILVYNTETLKDHFERLRKLGMPLKNLTGLLARNPETIEQNYNYLLTLGVPLRNIQNLPMLLAENPDAFAKKLRIIKVAVYGFKRDALLEEGFYKCAICSPATLVAKKKFLTDRDVEHTPKTLLRDWNYLFSLTSSKTTKNPKVLGKEIVKPFKLRYDSWMKEYKRWATDFTVRTGRKLIRKI